MAKELEEVVALKDSYKDNYADRHAVFKKLRRYWQGDYWQLAKEAGGERSIATIFRDIGRHNNAPPLNVQVVNNVIQQVCVKYQTFLAPLPQIRMYVDPPETANRKRQATDKERFLYGCWANGQMSKRFRELGWYLPLMGDAFIGAYPDFDRGMAVPILRSPEVTYPIPSFGRGGDESYVFHWQERDSVLSAAFPNYVPTRQQERSKVIFGMPLRKQGRASDPLVDVFEFSDCDEFDRWAGGQKLNGVDHNYGFNFFGHAKFIEVPGETWGHGAVEQAVNLNEVDNLLYSMLVASVYENVFPSLVIKNPAAAPEEIIKGPGSVIPLQADGDASYLLPPVQALPIQMGFIQSTRQSILQASSMSVVVFGQSPVTSILTGAAVNELQGAGTGSTVEMVQGSLGLELAELNEKFGIIQQTLFRDDKVTLYASRREHVADMAPKQGAITIKGSQLIGGWRNEIIFSPAMSQHDKLVMWLQAKGGGLVSDQYIREQVGIPDNEAMQEEIVGEQIQAAVLQFVLQTLTDPSQQEAVEARAFQVIDGGAAPTVRAGAPTAARPAAPALAGGAGGPPTIPLGGGGVAAAPPLGLPPGSPQSQGPQVGAPSQAAPSTGPGPAQPGPVTLQTAQRELSQVPLQGRAWLVGEIAQTATARGPVEIAVTDKADQQPLADAADFPTTFHLVSGAPKEKSVEITAQAQAA